ncbi:MAG: hypothetical protein JXQ75_23760, partial [Phycisphaerae bacterium]|nr:hypothetical protein [Phycisphaerae bacterium]
TYGWFTRSAPPLLTTAQTEALCNIVGGVISPLLANLTMRRFVLGWKMLGHEARLGACIVNYADDFVILCRGTAGHAATAMREMMTRLKLTVNESKTRICRVPGESFDFPGYTIGRCYSTQTGRVYIGTRPSRTRIKHLCGLIREVTRRQWTLLETADRVERLNRMLIGWSPVGGEYGVIPRELTLPGVRAFGSFGRQHSSRQPSRDRPDRPDRDRC